MAAELIYTGVKYDSLEEVWFAMWLDELKQAGYVASFEKVLKPFPLTKGLYIEYEKKTQLKTKVKVEQKKKTLLHPSEYTPDFNVHWTKKGLQKFLFNLISYDLSEAKREFEHLNTDVEHALFYSQEYNETWIEVKPEWDQNNMERLFRNNQKFLWDKHQIFVNLVEPVSLFKKTFLPLKAEPDFIYKKNPTGKNKGKKFAGDWKIDWTPKTLKQYVATL